MTQFKHLNQTRQRLCETQKAMWWAWWVMVEWSVSQWIQGVMMFQKIFGLYGVKRHKVEKWSG